MQVLVQMSAEQEKLWTVSACRTGPERGHW